KVGSADGSGANGTEAEEVIEAIEADEDCRNRRARNVERVEVIRVSAHRTVARRFVSERVGEGPGVRTEVLTVARNLIAHAQSAKGRIAHHRVDRQPARKRSQRGGDVGPQVHRSLRSV